LKEKQYKNKEKNLNFLNNLFLYLIWRARNKIGGGQCVKLIAYIIKKMIIVVLCHQG